MKSRLYLSCFCLAAVSIFSCSKSVNSNLPIGSASSENANLKIVNANAYATNYSLQLKVNNDRISNNISYNTPFPGGGLNTGGSNVPWYMSVYPGATNITMSLPKAGTNEDSVVLVNRLITTQASKYYTAFFTDTAANTKVVLVQDNIEYLTGNTSKFKFVHLMPNVPAVDVYFGGVKVFSNVQYQQVTPEMHLTGGTTGVWQIRTAGAAATATPIASYPTTGSQTIPYRRGLTVYSRGYNGATGNRAPAISEIYTQ